MPFAVGVFEPADHRLGGTDELGEVGLGEFRLYAALSDQSRDMSVGPFTLQGRISTSVLKLAGSPLVHLDPAPTLALTLAPPRTNDDLWTVFVYV